MTLEEKLARIQESAMTEARNESNTIVDNYRHAMEKVLEDHKEEALMQSQTRIRAEKTSAKRELTQVSAKAQLELKRRAGKLQMELKDKIFEEANDLITDYIKSPEYKEFMINAILSEIAFAPNEEMTIYINASDADLKDELEAATGAGLTLSREDFIGGSRAVIRGRNVMIDHSFATQLRNEYDNFIFLGGVGID